MRLRPASLFGSLTRRRKPCLGCAQPSLGAPQPALESGDIA
jgi:hypothetical protein